MVTPVVKNKRTNDFFFSVEGGLQSSGTTCPDGWLYYADACWHAAYFSNKTKTRDEADEYCQVAGGTLAEIRNEAEHWFAYTLFIYTITGTIFSQNLQTKVITCN